MTELGIVGAGPVASVDGKGVVDPGGWVEEIDWWVGAEDRWHFASDEVAVRQELGEDGASVATRLKVPGGDIVQHSGVVPHDGDGAVLLEITNETPVPVVIALALRGRSAAQITVNGEGLRVDGLPVLRAGKPAAAFSRGSTMTAVREEVTSGQAQPPASAAPPGAEDSAVAVLWPLPHTATLRIMVPLASVPVLPSMEYVPTLAAVGRGWQSHLDGGMRFTGPDDRLSRAVDAARRHALSVADLGPEPVPARVSWERPLVAAALNEWGHHQVALEMLLQLTSASTPEAERRADHLGATVWALARHVAITGDTALVDASAAWLSDAVAVLAKLGRPAGLLRRAAPVYGQPPVFLDEDSYETWSRQWVTQGLAAAAHLFDLLGETRTADDIRHSVGGTPDPLTALGPVIDWAFVRTDNPATMSGLLDIAAEASVTGALGTPRRAHDPVASALLLLLTRQALVNDAVARDAASGEARTINVMESYPDAWVGAGVEVHEAPSVVGPVSFGVRWHGERPALLWQRADDHRLALEAGRIAVPGLDGDWFSDDARGEALLAATAVARPDSPITAPVEGTPGAKDPNRPQGEPPAEGGSFS